MKQSVDKSNDPWAAFEFNNEFEGRDFLSRDDWHLCDGLLSVFMNKDYRQTIEWKKDKTASSQEQMHQSMPSEKVVLLDFGSYKQTISIDGTSYGSNI